MGRWPCWSGGTRRCSSGLSWWGGLTGVATGDFDGDGRVDFALPNDAPDYVQCFAGKVVVSKTGLGRTCVRGFARPTFDQAVGSNRRPCQPTR